MVKFLGAVMTGLACAYLGLRMSITLKKRVRALSDILASLEMLESEISFSVNRLKKAFLRADRNGLFSCAANNMDQTGAGESWRRAVAENKSRLCLTDADCEGLNLLSANLGRTDAQEQLKSIRYVKTILREQEKQAQSEYARVGKLYRSGGVLVGIMIVIILV